MFEDKDETYCVTRESVSDLLKVTWVVVAQSCNSIRVFESKIYNVISLSIRNSSSYQTFMLKYKHFLRPLNNLYLFLHFTFPYDCSVRRTPYLNEISDF